MKKQLFTISLYAERMIDTYNHHSKFHYYHGSLREAYDFLVGCKFLSGKYLVYVDTLDGLMSIQNDADWALALLKYSDYGITKSADA